MHRRVMAHTESHTLVHPWVVLLCLCAFPCRHVIFFFFLGSCWSSKIRRIHPWGGCNATECELRHTEKRKSLRLSVRKSFPVNLVWWYLRTTKWFGYLVFLWGHKVGRGNSWGGSHCGSWDTLRGVMRYSGRYTKWVVGYSGGVTK